jgi:Na+/proline symporter
MTPGFIAISIIFGIILLGAVTGIYSGIRRKMNLEQWTVAGRGFGLIFVWVLMAGRLTPPSLFLAPADGLIRAARPRVVVGVGAAMILTLTKQDPLMGLNAGVVALRLNIAVTVAASVFASAHRNGLEEQPTTVVAGD